MNRIGTGTRVQTAHLGSGEVYTGSIIEVRPPQIEEVLYLIWLDNPYRDENGKDAYSLLLEEREFTVLS